MANSFLKKCPVCGTENECFDDETKSEIIAELLANDNLKELKIEYYKIVDSCTKCGYASYDFKPFGKEGSSSIIKNDGETLKIVEESKLTPEEDANHEKIQQIINESHVNFDTKTDDKKHEVTEIKMGNTGVIRKRNGGFVQMNDSADAEKFKKINTGEHTSHLDKDVHQKIQLMTVKKSAEVETPKTEEQKVITVTPKNDPITEEEILSNMMINKIKIEKKQSPIAETAKQSEETKPTKSTTRSTTKK